jgi:hypothetical protein
MTDLGQSMVIYDYSVPIWMECDRDHDGKPDAYVYLHKGKDVLMLGVDKEGNVTGGAVTYYGTNGKPTLMWVDRTGTGDFPDRVRYTDRQAFKELWCEGAWRVMERSNEVQDVRVDGQWLPVVFTNGVWVLRRD